MNSKFFSELPYNDYFEYFGPDFKLHIQPSNMQNQNTPDYLDKIKYEPHICLYFRIIFMFICNFKSLQCCWHEIAGLPRN